MWTCQLIRCQIELKSTKNLKTLAGLVLGHKITCAYGYIHARFEGRSAGILGMKWNWHDLLRQVFENFTRQKEFLYLAVCANAWFYKKKTSDMNFMSEVFVGVDHISEMQDL